MSKIEQFKEFVQENPVLIEYVKDNKMTWQKFYEMYDLYGADNSIWNEYKSDLRSAAPTALGFAEFFEWLKTIDMNSIQSGLSSIERVIGVIKDFNKPTESTPKESYKPRPLYKSFED